MRVLITGHQGYIGPIMVRLFKEAGHVVTGLDTGYFRDCLTSPVVISPDTEIIKDIRNIGVEDVRGFDCIVHLAGLSNDPMGELDPSLTEAINFEAGIRTASFAKAAGVGRFIFASSCSLYGAGGGEDALTEEAALNPVSAYALSKARTEETLRGMADDTFSPVYLRNATAYGVSPRMRLDLVLNNLMAWAKASRIIRITSDGTPWRPIVHIEDISRAALAAATAPRTAVHNMAFNIGHNSGNYRIRDIAEVVRRQVPTAKIEITGETAGDPRSYKVNFDRATRQLPGFYPEWTIERGCEELNDWFEPRRESIDSYQTWRYVRLKQLKKLVAECSLSDTLYWVTAS